MGIHGGRRFLINGRFACVPLGTDCTARCPQPAAKPALFRAACDPIFVKISRRMQISHSVDTMVHVHKCHVFFSSRPLHSHSAAYNHAEGRNARLPLQIICEKQTRREQLEEKFCLGTLLLLKFDAASENEPTVRGSDFLFILCSGLQLFPLSCTIKNLGFASCATLRHVS